MNPLAIPTEQTEEANPGFASLMPKVFPNIEIRAQGKLFLNSDFSVYKGPRKDNTSYR